MPRPSLALARDPNFRALWIGQLISIFGDRFTYLALLAVIVARARAPENPAAELALLPLVSFLPAIVFGPWIGAWIDRNDTRRVLIASDAARGVVVLAMIPATLAGGLPALFALVFLLYVANTFFLPARSAIMPLLVPEERLTEANSLATFAGVAATIGGSLAGGYLVARFGWRWGFALDAATYFVSVVALWMIRIPPPAGAARPSADATAAVDAAARYRRLLADVREGCAILLRTPRAWGAVGATMLLWMAGGVLHVAVPILIGGGGGGGAAGAGGRVASGVGMLLAATACGMVAGTLLLAARGKRAPARARLAVALLGTGAALAGFASAPSGPPAAASAFVAGFFVAALLVTTETLVQEAVGAAARARVFALRDVAARIGVLVTAGIAGAAMAGGFPPRTAVFVTGGLTAAAGMAMLWAGRAAGATGGASLPPTSD